MHSLASIDEHMRADGVPSDLVARIRRLSGVSEPVYRMMCIWEAEEPEGRAETLAHLEAMCVELEKAGF